MRDALLFAAGRVEEVLLAKLRLTDKPLVDAVVELDDHSEMAPSTGTKMPRTNWKDMSNFRVVIPPPSLAEAFDTLLQPFVERIESNIHEVRALVGIRDALLPKLISGELRVGEAGRKVEEVL